MPYFPPTECNGVFESDSVTNHLLQPGKPWWRGRCGD